MCGLHSKRGALLPLCVAYSTFFPGCSSGTGGTSGGSSTSRITTSSSSSGSNGGATSAGGSSSGGISGGSTGGTAAAPVTLSFPTVTVPPGEATSCVVVNLGNSTPVHLGEIHNVLSAGAFTFVVYRSSDTQPQPTPFACDTFSHFGLADSDAPLIFSHKADDDLTLPAGVGLTLQANQMLRLELHAYNGSVGSTDVSAASTLVPMADSQFQTEAAFLLIGDVDVSIPANGNQTVQGFVTLPASVVPAGAQFTQVDGNTHSLGTQVTVGTAASVAGANTLVYDITNWPWSNSPRVDTEPPFALPAGGGFNLSCEYTNTTPQPVHFGPSASDEICFFGAYVYPSNGAFICTHTAQSGGLDNCCPGGGGCN